MRSMRLISAVLLSLCLGHNASAQMLVNYGEIAPGTVSLINGWNNGAEFSRLITLQRAAGGHHFGASGGGINLFSAVYYYQGDEAQLQQLIDALKQIRYPYSSIQVHAGERFWDGDGLIRRRESLPYDWRLEFHEAQVHDVSQSIFPKDVLLNQPVMVLNICLGQHLDRTKLRLPEELLSKQFTILERVNPPAPDSPANAQHAIARARRFQQ